MPKDNTLNNLQYNGIPGWQLNQGGQGGSGDGGNGGGGWAQGNWAPNWGLDQITTALANDAANQQRIAELLDQLPVISFWADVDIPFTGVASEVVTSNFKGTSDMYIISCAQTDVSVGKVKIESRSLSSLLMQDPVLISALAATAQDANRFLYWPNPLLVPSTTQLAFQWTNDANDPASAGTFSMKGRILKGGDPTLVQELIQRLNNMPFWVNVDIPYTSVANEAPANSFLGIANPMVVIGAQTDVQKGTVLADVQNLSSQLSKTPVRILAMAGLSGAIQPIEIWPQPVIVPPNTVISFQFRNSATNPSPAGSLALFGRLIRQQ